MVDTAKTQFTLPMSDMIKGFSNPVQLPSVEELAQASQVTAQAPAQEQAPSLRSVKQASLEEASKAKKYLLGGSDELRRLGTAVQNGNDAGQDPVLQELATGSMAELALKYGPGILQDVDGLRDQMRRNAQVEASSRTGDEIISDSILGVGAGAVNSLGGMAAMGAGVVSDEAGAYVSDLTNDAAGYVRSGQSPEITDKRELGAIRSDLNQEDANNQYAQDLKDGTSFAGLRRFGREVVDTIKDLATHPELAGDMTAEGMGSLVASLGVGKVAASAAAKLVLKSQGLPGQAAKTFLKSAKGRSMVQNLVEKGMPASIGLMEGGGAYAQIQSEIQAMGEDELLDQSPEYRGLRDQGMSHEDARNQIANAAGLEGGAIQGLIGAATGKLVAKFEADPLNVTSKLGLKDSLQEFGSNVIKEATEEGFQNASGSIVSNLAIQNHADPGRDIFAGAGSSTIEGVVAGSGMAAGLRAPDVALSAATTGARVGLEAGAEAIKSRMSALAQKLDAASPVGSKAMGSALDSLRATVDGARELVRQDGEARRAREELAKTSGEGSPVSEAPKSVEASAGLAAKLQDAFTIMGSEVNSFGPGLTKAINPTGAEIPDDMDEDRIAILKGVVSSLEGSDLSEADRNEAALWLYDQTERMQALKLLDKSALPKQFQDAIQPIFDDLETIVSNKTVQDAIAKAQTMSKEALGPLPDVTTETVNSTEVKRAATQTAILAQANPLAVDRTFAQALLDQKFAGRGPLLDKSVESLQAAIALLDLDEKSQKAKSRIAAAMADTAEAGSAHKASIKLSDMVRNEITDLGFDGSLGAPAEGTKRKKTSRLGLNQYVAQIVEATNKGDIKGAQRLLNRMGNFAQHMINKAEAASVSLQKPDGTDRKTYFQTWNGRDFTDGLNEDSSSVTIWPQNRNSVLLGQDIQIDANTAVELYNNLVQIYGKTLKGKAMTMPSVDARLQEGGTLPASNASNTDVEEDSDLVVIEDIEPDTKAPETKTPEAQVPEAQVSEAHAEEAPVTEAPTETETSEVSDPAPEKSLEGNKDLSKAVSVIADQLDAMQFPEDQVMPVQRQIKVLRRVEALLKTGNADRLYEAQERLFDASYALSDMGLTKIGKALDDLSQPILDAASALLNTSAENTSEAKPKTEPTEKAVEETAAPEAEAAAQPEDEAQVTEEKEDQEEDPTDTQTTKEEALEFPDLVQSKGGLARFMRAFSIKPARSLIISEENPARFVVDLLRKVSDLRNKTHLKYGLDEEVGENLAKFIESEGSDIIKMMNHRLDQKQKGLRGGKFSPKDMLDAANLSEKDDPSGWAAAKALNIVDVKTGKYDKRLVQAAMLGALHWLLTTRVGMNPDREDVARMFGVQEIQVTDAMLRAGQSGVSRSLAVEDLSRYVLAFWGAEINRTAPMSDTIGIANAVASELLVSMRDLGVISEEVVEIPNNDQMVENGLAVGGTHKGYVIYPVSQRTENLLRSIKGANTVLGDMISRDREPGFLIGEVPKGRRWTQKGNKLGVLGQKIKKALGVHRETAFYRNTSVLDFLSFLGEESLQDLSGYQKIEDGVMNKTHEIMVRGKNNQIVRSWNGVMNHDSRVQAYARETDTDLEKVPTHFDWFVVSNGRIHADGFNPQLDKLMREAFISTISKLNLENADDLARFWVTVAQSAGVSKTERVTRAVAAAAAEEAINTKLPKTLQLVQDWMARQEIAPEAREAMLRELKAFGEFSPKVLHSAIAVARMRAALALPAGDIGRTQFEHGLSLEADGKTDGPINALIHFTAGAFKLPQLMNMRRGGMFIGERDRTLNQQNERDQKDLYEVGAEATKEFMAKTRKSMKGSEAEPVMEAFLRVMNRLGDFRYDPKTGDLLLDLKIGRGELKNPLTITVYGSGKWGTAGKISSALTDSLYKAMTEANKLQLATGDNSLTLDDLEQFGNYGGTKFTEDLKILFGSPISFGEQGWFLDRTKKAKPLWFKNPDTFKLNEAQSWVFQNNVKFLFVNPMTKAIDSIIGEAKGTLEEIQKMTRMQSNVMIWKFQNELKSRLAAKRASGELASNEFLSQADYDQIFKDLVQYAAVIEPINSNENHVNLSRPESELDTSYNFGHDFSEELQGTLRLMTPSRAGVGGQPMMTISRGDAQMMVNLYADGKISKEDLQRTLQVFDGLEMPADAIERLSEAVNQAVADSWMVNPMQDVADSFRAYLRSGFAKDLTEEQKNILKEILLGRSNPDMALPLEMVLQNKEKDLTALALQIQARKETMGEFGFSVDHMASGEKAYTHEGKFPEVKSMNDLVDQMNAAYEEKLAALYKKEALSRDAKTTVQKPSEHVKAWVDALPQKVGKGSVKKTTMKGVLWMLRDSAVSPEYRAMVSILSKLAPKYSFMFGSAEDLTAYRNETYTELADNAPIQLGQTDATNKVIYITNLSEETVMHELLHAVLWSVISEHYIGQEFSKSPLSQVQQDAIANLEALMREFASLDLSMEDAGTQSVARTLRAEIEAGLQGQGVFEKSVALSEFISWTLTNQKLARVAQTTKVRSKLIRLVHKALGALKSLLGIPQDAWMDMFSKISENAMSLAQFTETTGSTDSGSGITLLNQASGVPSDRRILDLAEKFETKISSHLREAQADVSIRDGNISPVYAGNVINAFARVGFQFTPERKSLFRSMVATLSTKMDMDNRALAQAHRIYTDVMKKLVIEDFMEDPTSENQNDREEARAKFELLSGYSNLVKDGYGRSHVLGAFLALSQIDDRFRGVLAQMDGPKDKKISTASLDELLSTTTEHMMDRLSTVIGERTLKARNARERLDQLSMELSEIETDDRTYLEVKSQEVLDAGDRYGAKYLSAAGEWLEGALPRTDIEGLEQMPLGIQKGLLVLGNTLRTLVSVARKDTVGESMVQLANDMRVPEAVAELVSEVAGMTHKTKDVYKLVNRAKYAISKMRQDYRTTLPQVFADQFSRKVSDNEQRSLFKGLGKTEIGSLGMFMSMAQIRDILSSDQAHAAAILDLEEKIKAKAGKRAKKILDKSEELAEFMVSGRIDPNNHNLLRNAEAVARLLGEPGAQKEASSELVNMVDQLVTLYAVGQTDPAVVADVRALISEEPSGVDFLVHYMTATLQKERAKAVDFSVRLNSYKGYIPSEVKEGISLVVDDASNFASRKTQGYSSLGAYEGSGLESGKKSYFFSTVAGNAPYQQGIMQTVRRSIGGVDARTGRTTGHLTAGSVGWEEVEGILDRIEEDKAAGYVNTTGESLMPVYHKDGVVVDFERSMDPAYLDAMHRDESLFNMLGAWSGRQAEEALSESFNSVLVKRLHEMWKDAKGTGEAEGFIDITKSKDPIYRDSWNLVPHEMREEIKKVFGEDGFKVRRDMVRNAIGYRLPSVADMWTGKSRIDPKFRQTFVDATTAIMGHKAFENLVRAEKFWQAGISAAKQTIVIRSLVVPMSNIASNVLQLKGLGVGWRDITKGFSTKLVEIDQHLKHLQRRVEIQAELARWRDNGLKKAQLEAELHSIEDADKRMSIWPLIEAGEFATISEGAGETEAAISEGRLADRIQELVDKIPQKLGTFGRYAMITRDTALFKGMSRTVQYGDFLAKAVLYDHMTKRDGKTSDQALEFLTEEFVNYNLQPGRMRSYSESMGVTWFWAYKLKSIKVAARHIKNNPLRALLSGLVAETMPDVPGVSVGSPLTDNWIGAAMGGGLPYSTGTDMLFGAPGMHPWVNLFE